MTISSHQSHLLGNSKILASWKYVLYFSVINRASLAAAWSLSKAGIYLNWMENFLLPSVPAKGLLRKKGKPGSQPHCPKWYIFTWSHVMKKFEHCLTLLHVCHQKVLFYVFFFFFTIRHVGYYLPDQGLNLHPLQWKVKS